MIWAHVYDAHGTWLGQFRSAELFVSWAEENQLDPNDYRIEMGPSKYPSS
jgi:hypothetical protein